MKVGVGFELRINKVLLEAVIDFLGYQKEKVHDIVNLLSKDEVYTYRFNLLSEYVVVINKYIEYLNLVIEQSHKETSHDDVHGEEVTHLFLEEEAIYDSNNFQKTINNYELELSEQGVSFTHH